MNKLELCVHGPYDPLLRLNGRYEQQQATIARLDQRIHWSIWASTETIMSSYCHGDRDEAHDELMTVLPDRYDRSIHLFG